MKVVTVLVMVIVIGFLTGCTSLMKSTENKQINFDSQVYGFKITAFDPASASVAPVGEFGFGSINYRSCPIEAGQPFYASYTVKSIWSSANASQTIIWIGRASEKGTLLFEAVPVGMFKISFDGIKTNEAELKIVPTK